MPPPTASLKPAPKPAGNKDKTPSTTLNAPAAQVDKADKLAKPDQVVYNKEQDEINKEIEGVKAKLNEIRNKLSLLHSPAGNENDRRSQIRAEMDALQGAQGQAKTERSKTLDQVKRLQEGVQQKIKEVQAQRTKMPYKNAEEIEQRIAHLNKQVESGTLKLIDEKKALAEITTLKRSLKQVSSTASVDESIAADRAKIEELRKILDDPENKKVQARWEELKTELDALRAEGNKAYEERSGLFDQRTALQKELDELYGRKRTASQKYREDGDAYWARVQQERASKQAQFRQQKAEEDAARRETEITRLREEAQNPAYAAEIEDCGVLIGWFKGKYGGGVPEVHAGEGVSEKAVLDGVKKLEIRKVEDEPIGVPIKKKGDDEDSWGGFSGGGGGKKKGKFGGGGGGGGGGKKSVTASGTATPSEEIPSTPSAAVNVPFSLLSALLSLSIPPPTTSADVSRCISDLDKKKAWFEANSQRKTKEEIERVELLVKKMQKKNEAVLDGKNGDEKVDELDEEEEGGNKEPLHTVAVAGDATEDVQVEQGEHLPTMPSSEALDKVDTAIADVDA